MTDTTTDVNVADDKTAYELLTVDASGPSCWGPVQWTALHQLLRGYPREDASAEKQDALKAYVNGLAGLIPCNACAQHWKSFAATVQTKNRHDALKWSIDAHNAVNARLGKRVYTYAEALRLLETQCVGNTYGCTNPQLHATAAPAWMYGVCIAAVVVFFVALTIIVVAAVMLSKNKNPKLGDV
jgi:hypothetical protein